MLAVVGTLLLSAALFVFAWARVEHKRARPARWVRYEIASQLVVFAILMFLASGAGLILHAVGTYDSNPIGLVEGSLIVAIVAAAPVLLIAYWRYGQRSLGDAVPGTAMGPLAMAQGSAAQGDELDPGPPDGRSPGGRGRRAI